MSSVHYRTCNLCEAMCGLAITVERDRVVEIRGDDEDPFSRGHLCPKAVALADVHDDPDRLRFPQRRTATGWETISWETALEEVTTRIVDVQRRHGMNAVGAYLGNPTVHNWGSILYGLPFLKALGTRNRFSATSVDQLPQMLAALEMLGHQALFAIPDVDRTQHFLAIGANPLVSNGSIMTAPGIERRLKELRARGGKLVVVDPRRTETAAIADRYVAIRPGTDAAFLLAFVHVLFAEERVRPGRLGDFTDGIDALRALAEPFTPERVAAFTGVAPDVTRAVARDFADAESAVCYGRVGACTQEFGGLVAWLVAAVNVLTGNLDRVGGAMFTTPAVDFVGGAAKVGERGHFAKGRSRVSGLPEFGGEYPAYVLAEEIETPGEGQIRALVTSAGNPVLSTPNGARLERALEQLELMVSIDIYRNETTRHAHYILPPTFALEHDHYDVALHLVAVRNTAKYMPALFAPLPGMKHDWEIFLELTTRLAAKRSLGGKVAGSLGRAVLGRMGPRGLLDLMLRTGPHGAGLVPGRKGLTLARLEREPHGVDLGPLEPRLPGLLYTREKRIQLAPRLFLDDVPRLAARVDAAATAQGNGELSLIGRRELRSNNSWMHNSQRLVKGKVRCTLRMHPDDAAKRGLVGGARVRVTSRVGSVEVPLEVTDEMMPGVVSLPHGWGHSRPGVKLGVAAAHAGVSANDLTDERFYDPLSGTAALSGVAVHVAAAAQRATTDAEDDAATTASATAPAAAASLASPAATLPSAAG